MLYNYNDLLGSFVIIYYDIIMTTIIYYIITTMIICYNIIMTKIIYHVIITIMIIYYDIIMTTVICFNIIMIIIFIMKLLWRQRETFDGTFSDTTIPMAWGIMTVKQYPTLPGAIELDLHHKIKFRVITRIRTVLESMIQRYTT